MKKIFSIFLLAIFLFDLVGFFPLFKYAQNKIQKEIKGQLKKTVPQGELYVINVPVEKVNDLDWKREGKEFRYNGTMYDIVKSETKNGVVQYHCINDKQETQLFANLEELVNQQMDNGKSPFGKTTKRILKKTSTLKYITTNPFVFALNNDINSNNFDYTFFYSPVFLEIFSPPPNTLV